MSDAQNSSSPGAQSGTTAEGAGVFGAHTLFGQYLKECRNVMTRLEENHHSYITEYRRCQKELSEWMDRLRAAQKHLLPDPETERITTTLRRCREYYKKYALAPAQSHERVQWKRKVDELFNSLLKGEAGDIGEHGISEAGAELMAPKDGELIGTRDTTSSTEANSTDGESKIEAMASSLSASERLGAEIAGHGDPVSESAADPEGAIESQIQAHPELLALQRIITRAREIMLRGIDIRAREVLRELECKWGHFVHGLGTGPTVAEQHQHIVNRMPELMNNLASLDELDGSTPVSDSEGRNLRDMLRDLRKQLYGFLRQFWQLEEIRVIVGKSISDYNSAFVRASMVPSLYPKLHVVRIVQPGYVRRCAGKEDIQRLVKVEVSNGLASPTGQ